MNRAVVFDGIMANVPNGWFDVTSDLPEGSPTTLAKSDGVGALQFSLAKYQAGVNPEIAIADLSRLLMQFADSRGLGAPLREYQGHGLHPYAAGEFEVGGELMCVWHLSNGRDVVLITYVTQQQSDSAVLDEIRDAVGIVNSLEFAASV